MTKTDEVMKKIEEGESTEDIMTSVGCSKGLVSQCRRKIKEADNENTNDLAGDDELSASYAGIRKVSLTPDPNTLTDTETKKKTSYNVECGGCGNIWVVDGSEHISECPACGVSLQ